MPDAGAGWAQRSPLCSGIVDISIGYMRTEAPILAPVFRSDGQARLLSEVLLAAGEVSIAEAASRAGVAYATAHGEAQRLLRAGILQERKIGRTRMVSGNPASPLVAPLREILLVATGPAPLLSEELGKINGVHLAFLYGSFAARSRGIDGPAPNDIDVMVVGDPDVDAVYDACARVEQAVGRPVNPTILSDAEFAQDTGFLRTVRDGATVPVIGESL